ncbi:MAG: S24 family peptidase, partial [Oscillospiraceae bacterium]|nr:S24 family peptidase [Oscillospiraceae bacterium]
YGNYLTNDGYKIRTFLKNEVPHGTDFCVRLDGDSMEPDYPNGSTVYVKAADAVDAGQIGIFMTDADGKAYCKKLIVDHHNRQTRLVSLNPEYEDIVITPDDDLRTVGRVLGVVREDKYK